MQQHHSAAPLRAAEVTRHCKLSDKARTLLGVHLGLDAFLGELSRAELHADAVRVMAFVLPARPALWWGCVCLWHVARPQPQPSAEAALRVVVQWVQAPSEKLRQDADVAAREAGHGCAAGTLARALFVSGGSISRAGLPEVKPPPGLFSTLLAASVLSASRSLGAAATNLCQRQFLAFANAVQNGRIPFAAT